MQNIGNTDRGLRAIAGLALIATEYLTNVARFEFVFLGIAIFGIFTSTFGWCPFYKIMGVSTCQLELGGEE